MCFITVVPLFVMNDEGPILLNIIVPKVPCGSGSDCVLHPLHSGP